VIDIGSGSGAFLDTIAKHYGADITGIDVESLLIEESRLRLKNCTFYRADPRFLDFLPPQQYDYVISFNLFSYFKNKEDIHSTLVNMVRLVKTNGIIFIGFVNDLSKWTANLDEYNCSQNAFLDQQFWKDIAWELGIEDLRLIGESTLQRGWFRKQTESSWYQYSVYGRKAGIIHG